MNTTSASRGNDSVLTGDPYLRWHWATKFAYLPSGRTRLPIVVRLGKDFTPKDFIERMQDAGIKHGPILASDEWSRYTTVYWDFRGTKRVVFTDPRFLNMFDFYMAGQPLHESLNSIDPDKWPQPKAWPSSSEAVSELPAANESRARVVVAVIDDGIAFAHKRFFDESGHTRICAFWDQDSAYWLSRQYIENRIAAHTFGGLVDEDSLYAEEGLDDYSTDEHKRVGRRIAHGTHVLDLATALPFGATSSDRPIIAVQLPRQVTSDPSGILLAPYIERALAFINDRMADFADEAGNEPPLVVNISYGMTGGPQDGTHLVERLLHEFITLREANKGRTEVVIAAGNVRLERGHALVAIGAQPVNVCWRVLPDDRTPSALEIWVPAGKKIQVRVKGPTDPNFGAWVTEDGQYPDPYVSAPCMIDYKSNATSGGRRVVLVRLLPTASPEPLSGTPTAPAGDWTIELAGDSMSGFCADVYVQRDDTPVGYKRLGRQSHLEESAYSQYDGVSGKTVEWDHLQAAASGTVRVGTLNAIATGTLPFVVGGYRRNDECSSPYSSLGSAPNSKCPSVAAVSDDSRPMHGVLAAGTRTGSTVAMNGTSVAAPQLTRWIADIFSTFGPVPRASLRALLVLDAAPAWNVPAIVRTQAVGHGLLELPQVPTLKTAGVVSR
jgi:Subtilase family